MRMTVRISRGALLPVLFSAGCLLAQDTSGGGGIASLDAAQEYLKRGDLGDAEKELSRFLDSNRQEPQAYNLLGFICDQTGRSSQALEYYKTALRLSPNFAPAHTNLGAFYFRQGKIDLARGEFLQTLRYRPDDLMANYNLGLIYIRLRSYAKAVDYLEGARRVAPDDPAVLLKLAQASFALGHRDEGLKAALALAPRAENDAAALLSLALLLLQYHLYKTARDCLVRADQAAPHTPEVLLALAQADFLSGGYDDAVDSIERFVAAFKQDPQESETSTAYLTVASRLLYDVRQKHSSGARLNYTLAEVLFLKKSYNQAVHVLNEQAADGKHTPEYFNLLGLCYAALDQFRQGARAIEKAIELDGAQSRYYFNLAGVYQKAGDNQAAVKILQRALARDPDSAETYFALGLSQFNLGYYSGALGNFSKALRMQPGFAQAQLLVGRSYEKLGRPSEAGSAYRQAIRSDPDYYPAYFRLALLLMHSGTAQEAVPFLKQVVRLNPLHANAHYDLGTLYARQGRSAEAIAELEKAISINTSYEPAYYQLGRLYAKLGNREKAQELFDFVNAAQKRKLEKYQEKVLGPE
jgi:tetratricopeptide (TPR) repeat protein